MALEYIIKQGKVLSREHTGHSKHPFPRTQETALHIDITNGHGQCKIKLIIFFAAKDGKAVNSHQKEDWELTVAQIMNFLLPNSDVN